MAKGKSVAKHIDYATGATSETRASTPGGAEAGIPAQATPSSEQGSTTSSDPAQSVDLRQYVLSMFHNAPGTDDRAVTPDAPPTTPNGQVLPHQQQQRRMTRFDVAPLNNGKKEDTLEKLKDSDDEVDHRHRHRLAVSLALLNSGSVARDHLASERTFLAYVRTSTAIASAGVALAQILSIRHSWSSSAHRLEPYARPLGAVSIVIAFLVLLMGAVRYFIIQQSLVKGIFPAARLHIVIMAVLLGSLVVVAFGLILKHGHLPKGLT